MTDLARGAWLVEWTERERGWGSRPDGCWYFPSEETAKARTAKQLKAIRDHEKELYKGATPEEYSSPEEPQFVPVSAKLAAEIADKGEVYRQHPEKRRTA